MTGVSHSFFLGVDCGERGTEDVESRGMMGHTGIVLSLCAMAWMAIASPVATPPAHAAPPNVVIVYPDDVGHNDVGFTEHTSEIETPNIDRLAREGVVFTQAYAASSICAPSRAALMTGKYPQRVGIESNPPPDDTGGLPPGEVTIAEMLRRQGYTTAMFGKWHLGTAPKFRPHRQGFDLFVGFLHAAHDYGPPTTLWSNDEQIPVNQYLTEEFASRAAAFIDQNKGGPFFLYVPFNAAHAPLQAPQEYVDRYGHIADNDRRTFAAMVSALDDGVGVIHEALVRNGLDDNTLIFFMSDNGGALWKGGDNDPLRAGKRTLYEGGIRVAAFMRWPGKVPAGQQYANAVVAMDIFASIAGATGAKAPEGLDGVDLLPYVQGRTGRPHRELYWRMGTETLLWYAARIDNQKLVGHNRIRPAVFDLASDREERFNIATPEKLDALTAKYRQWEARVLNPLN
jgi:arylsulfatase A-like enzyme